VPRRTKATARPTNRNPATTDPQSVPRSAMPHLHVPDVGVGPQIDHRRFGTVAVHLFDGFVDTVELHTGTGRPLFTVLLDTSEPHACGERHPRMFGQEHLGVPVDGHLHVHRLTRF